MYMYYDCSGDVCVIDLLLGIPSRNAPLGNSRWTRSITTDLFSPKTVSEANFLCLKCTRGEHGQNTWKSSKVSNIFEAFYIGYMYLALAMYKAHIAMETHVKNVFSRSCLLPKLFLSHLCRHWGRVHCCSTAAGESQVQPWALAAGKFGAQQGKAFLLCFDTGLPSACEVELVYRHSYCWGVKPATSGVCRREKSLIWYAICPIEKCSCWGKIICLLFSREMSLKIFATYCINSWLNTSLLTILFVFFWLLILYSIYFNNDRGTANGVVGGEAWDTVKTHF